MKAVLLHSGGLDSTVLLYHLRASGHDAKCLSVDYGQRHRRELWAARDICESCGVEHQVADLSGIRQFLAGSALTDSIDVPDGHYTDESMKVTVVPNRNMLMLAVATAWAVSLKYDAVAYAAHHGDHAIYPDCRPEFVCAMGAVIERCDWHNLRLECPFVDKSKGDVVRLGAELGVPFDKTWSCYKGEAQHCGKCGTCVERKEAFELAGVADPTIYASAS